MPNMELLNLLIAEDSKMYSGLLSAVLHKKKVGLLRYTITCVSTLADTIKAIEEETVDILLLDLSLPDSQGLETFSKIKALGKKLPIIIITGEDDVEIAVKALRLGVDEFIFKASISSSSLAHTIYLTYMKWRIRNE